jgi:hypothetical protein
MPDQEKRLVELATGFALGELEQQELQELHERIRAEDHEGDQATLIVWQTLGISVDLRAVLDTQFASTVLSKLESAGDQPGPDSLTAGSDRSRSFLRTLAARMGIARPALDPVESPTPTARPRRSPRMLLWAIPALLAALLLGFYLFGRGRTVTVRTLTGSVTIEGRAVVPGQSLPRSPVIVASGGTLELQWKSGHSALVSGPANLMPSAAGLSLSSGSAWIRTRGEFTLGLPDGGAQTSAPSSFAAVIRENRSMIGVSSGTAIVTVRYQQHVLQPGSAMVLDGPGFVWHPRLTWKDTPSSPPAKLTVRSFDDASAAPAWHLRFRVRWSSASDSLRFIFPATRQAGPPQLLLSPGSVRVKLPGKPPRTYQLPGAPLLARTVRLNSPHAGKAVLIIEGLDEPIAIPDRRFPASLEISGKPKLVDFAARIGPQQRPAGD